MFYCTLIDSDEIVVLLDTSENLRWVQQSAEVINYQYVVQIQNRVSVFNTFLAIVQIWYFAQTHLYPHFWLHLYPIKRIHKKYSAVDIPSTTFVVSYSTKEKLMITPAHSKKNEKKSFLSLSPVYLKEFSIIPSLFSSIIDGQFLVVVLKHNRHKVMFMSCGV